METVLHIAAFPDVKRLYKFKRGGHPKNGETCMFTKHSASSQKAGQPREVVVKFHDGSTLTVQYPREMELIETAEDFVGRRRVDPPASNPDATIMEAWTWDQERRKAVRENQEDDLSSTHTARNIDRQRDNFSSSNDVSSSSVGAHTQRFISHRRHRHSTDDQIQHYGRSVQGSAPQSGAVPGQSYPAYPQGRDVGSQPYGGQMHAQSLNSQWDSVPTSQHTAYPRGRTINSDQYPANQSPYAPASSQSQPMYPPGAPSQTYGVEGTAQSALNQWGAAQGPGYLGYSQDQQRQFYSQMPAQVPNTQWNTVPYPTSANRGRGPTAPPDRQTAADFYAANPGIPYPYATQSTVAAHPGYGGHYDDSAGVSRRGNGYWDANGYYHEQSDGAYDGRPTHD